MPYILDYTPSGAHILFQNLLGYSTSEELQKIGYLENDLIKACNYIDPNDIRRWYGISLDAARVFSGLGKIAEYIALLTMEAFKENESMGLFPVTISDVHDRCLNFDNSWSEGSPNPSALQPKNMIGLVYDFLIHAHWKPKHIANVLRDIYQNPSFSWTQDFYKYPAEEKANFWARTYSVVSLWKTGRLNL